MSEPPERSAESTKEFGITDEDLEQIQSYLRKQAHSRTVDDLRPLSRE